MSTNDNSISHSRHPGETSWCHLNLMFLHSTSSPSANSTNSNHKIPQIDYFWNFRHDHLVPRFIIFSLEKEVSFLHSLQRYPAWPKVKTLSDVTFNLLPLLSPLLHFLHLFSYCSPGSYLFHIVASLLLLQTLSHLRTFAFSGIIDPENSNDFFLIFFQSLC